MVRMHPTIKMVNYGFVVVVFSTIISITYGGLLGDLSAVSSLTSFTNNATGNVLPEVSKLTYDAGLQAILIPGVGNLGTVGFPVNILCKLRGVYDYAFCCVCNQDCIVVHGTYGGKCGPDPKNPKEFKCLCAETEKEAKDRKIYPSSRDTCAGFPLGKLPYDIAKLEDELVRNIVQINLDLILCPKYTNGTEESSGCNTDCQTNHGLKGGRCGYTIPKVPKSGNTDFFALSCNCLQN